MDVAFHRKKHINKERLEDADPTPGKQGNAARESMKEMLRRVRDQDVDFETADIYLAPGDNTAYISQIGACHE